MAFIEKTTIKIEIRYGSIALSKIGLNQNFSRLKKISISLGRKINAHLKNNTLILNKPLIIPTGKTLTINLEG